MTDSVVQQIFGLLGQLIAAGGGGAVISYALFKFFGESWIHNRLARDLEAAKSELSIVAARKLKLYDMEYVVFPEMWSKLNNAINSLGSAVAAFREMPDFGRMTADNLREWTDRAELSDDEKSYFSDADDKIRAYSRLLEWRDLLKAQREFIEFHNYLQKNRIFVDPQIKNKLDQIDNLIWEAWVAKKMDWQGYSKGAENDFLLKAYEIYNKQVKPLMLEIENLVQAKLFPGSQSGGDKGESA